jgi:hypothetical protein
VIDWPKLSTETVERLQALPIWDIAVQTEGKARLRMACYARLVKDPDMRSAIALNALGGEQAQASACEDGAGLRNPARQRAALPASPRR